MVCGDARHDTQYAAPDRRSKMAVLKRGGSFPVRISHLGVVVADKSFAC
jgi:hypothetical protein